MTSGILPIAFGPAQGRLFGTLYYPRERSCVRAVGLVLCAPLGWELIASQRSHRMLADQLAAAGFYVLRFDYHGTGDSPGDETEPGRLAAWLQSVGAAVDELRRRTAVAKICLIGTRAGATLANLFAAHRPDEIAGQILWAPYLNGRAYLRELRAYRLLNDERALGPPADEDEAAGFVISPATAEQLETVDLLASTSQPPAPVLLLMRDAHSPEESLATHLRGLGAAVTLQQAAGFAEMMQEPRKSVVPHQVFAAIQEWLQETFTETRAPTWIDAAERAVIEHDGVREEALFFGDNPRMYGVLIGPQHRLRNRRRGLLWLNTSFEHRIGPNRQYVSLARELAKLGYTSLRFDPRAVGDCPPTPDDPQIHAYSQARLADTRNAIDWFAERTGRNRLVLIGLCSAAYVAFHVGLTDPRIVAQVMINPQTFLWKEGDPVGLVFASNRAYQRKLFNPKVWMRALRGRVDFGGIARMMSARLVKRTGARCARFFNFLAQPAFDVRSAFLEILRRGASVLLILGENDNGLEATELHLGANARLLRGQRGFHLEIVPGSDHTFSQSWAKQWLAARVIRYIEHGK